MTGQTTPAERCKPAVKTYWLPLAVTLLVPMTSLIIYGTTLGNRLDAIAQDVEDNGASFRIKDTRGERSILLSYRGRFLGISILLPTPLNIFIIRC